MSINTEKYDGVHFQVVLMNTRDGGVEGHAAGCADLKRGTRKFSEPYQANDVWDVTSKHDAWENYNSDFIPECVDHENCDEANGVCINTYPIKWLPCASHVPAKAEADSDEAILEGVDAAVAAGEMEVFTPAGVTTRVGRKWTYVFVDGEEVAYVRNDMVALVISTLSA